MSIECFFGPNAARLTMTGPITQTMVLDMRRQFRVALEYYMHDHIEIEINSPGGDANALKALAAEMSWLRSHNCVISTTGLIEAGSAAALTLALGDIGLRSVQPYTNLLFHHARVVQQGENAMTAIHANAAASQLQRLDVQVINMLISHLTWSQGGLHAMAMVGLDRCQTLQREAAKILQELGPEAIISANLVQKTRDGGISGAWFKSTIVAYQRVLKSSHPKAFSNLMASLFALDSRMPLEMAWCLQLIDGVEGSSVLKPEVKTTPTPSSEASNSPSMRLAA